jgi:hypothetical protein
MMPEYFVQTEYNDTEAAKNRVKVLLACSYAIKLLSFVFVFLSFKNVWYIVGFIATYAVGICLRQSVLQLIGRYEYFLVRGVLKIKVFTNFEVERQSLEIPLSLVTSAEDAVCAALSADVLAAPEGQNGLKIIYKDGDVERSVSFAPSRYLRALLFDKME